LRHRLALAVTLGKMVRAKLRHEEARIAELTHGVFGGFVKFREVTHGPRAWTHHEAGNAFSRRTARSISLALHWQESSGAIITTRCSRAVTAKTTPNALKCKR
jgi:hypothetical protein